MRIRVVLADATAPSRARSAGALAAGDIDVVARCGDGVETLDAVRRVRPDVVVLDSWLPGLDGLEVTRRVVDLRRSDRPRVVLTIPPDDADCAYTALCCGVHGLLTRSVQPTRLAQAVRTAAGGQLLIGPDIADRLVRRLADAPSWSARAPAGPVTVRELDAIRLVARGLTNHEIARELFVSLSTVKTHLASAQAKLGLRNRVELAAWAWNLDRQPAPTATPGPRETAAHTLAG